MKQQSSNGWTRPQSTRGMGRGARRHNNGGPFTGRFPRQNHGASNHYSQKSTARFAFFDNMKERLTFTLRNMAGRKVTVKKLDGLVVEGVLLASGNESTFGRHVTLQYSKVVEKPKDFNEEVPSGAQNYVIDWAQVESVSVDDVDSQSAQAAATHQKLKTDSEIAKKSIQAGKLSGRTLQPVSSSWVEKETNVNGSADFNPSEKAKHWDQFKTNEQKFGVKGTYDENLYTTKLEKSKLTSEQIKKAETLAKEIESNPASNPHIRDERNQQSLTNKNDDEEAKFSSVARPSATNVPAKPPMSFAAALMKGKTPVLPPPPPRPAATPVSFETPVKADANGEKPMVTPVPGGQKASDGTTPENSSNSKTGRSSKYKVSGIDFSEYSKNRRKQQTPNWEAHNLTKNVWENSARKSREQQIKEFKQFSTELEKKKELSPEKGEVRKTLNVNAKEFQPPPASVDSGSEETSNNPIRNTPAEKPSEPSQLSRHNSVMSNAGSNVGPQLQHQFAAQPGMVPVPVNMPGGYPLHFYQPVMVPGQQAGFPAVYPVGPNQVVFQPMPQQAGSYLVPMVPPQHAQMHMGQQRVMYNAIPPHLMQQFQAQQHQDHTQQLQVLHHQMHAQQPQQPQPPPGQPPSGK